MIGDFWTLEERKRYFSRPEWSNSNIRIPFPRAVLRMLESKDH